MASLTKKRGVFYLLDRVDGKLKWHRLGPIPYRAAETVLARYKVDADYAKLNLSPEHTIKWKDCVEEYIKYQHRLRSPQTNANEEWMLEKLGRELNNPELRRVQSVTIQALIKGSPAHQRNQIIAVRGMFKYALQKGYLKKNISLELKKPKIQSLPPRYADPNDIKKVMEHMSEDVRNKFSILLYTGMRPSEMLRLKPSDIDFAKGTITIKVTKTGRFRIIPISSQIKPILERLCQGARSDYLFPGVHGHQLTVREGLKKACENAGITITAYQFRHTFATLVLEQTRDLRTVQQLLGHSTIAMTTRYATSYKA